MHYPYAYDTVDKLPRIEGYIPRICPRSCGLPHLARRPHRLLHAQCLFVVSFSMSRGSGVPILHMKEVDIRRITASV